MPTQIGDGGSQAIGVMPKRPYSPITVLAQQSANLAGPVIMVNGQVLESPLVAASFRSPANGTAALLLNEHCLVGASGNPIIDSSLDVKTILSMPIVIGPLTGQFLGMRFGFRQVAPLTGQSLGTRCGSRVVLALVLAPHLRRGVPPSRRRFSD